MSRHGQVDKSYVLHIVTHPILYSINRQQSIPLLDYMYSYVHTRFPIYIQILRHPHLPRPLKKDISMQSLIPQHFFLKHKIPGCTNVVLFAHFPHFKYTYPPYSKWSYVSENGTRSLNKNCFYSRIEHRYD